MEALNLIFECILLGVNKVIVLVTCLFLESPVTWSCHHRRRESYVTSAVPGQCQQWRRIRHVNLRGKRHYSHVICQTTMPPASENRVFIICLKLHKNGCCWILSKIIFNMWNENMFRQKTKPFYLLSCRCHRIIKIPECSSEMFSGLPVQDVIVTSQHMSLTIVTYTHHRCQHRERKSGTESTQKCKKRESVIFSPPGGATDTAVHRLENTQILPELRWPGISLSRPLRGPDWVAA